ncbi:diacylglycerol kinase family protein [soil metagenome]
MTKDGIHINIIVMNKEQSLLKGFYNAWKGIQNFFLHDRNGRIHLGAGIATVLAGFILKVSAIEWVVLLICIAVVISLEMINAAIEKLCDMVHKDFHPGIKIIKDISAGAVLLAAVISIVIGTIIFLPKIIEML